MPKEIVTLHIGQAGVQMGSAMWELYCIEHGVTAEGKLSQNKEPNLNDRIETLFCESNNQFIPRTVFVDLEPTVVDEIRTGVYRDLFSPSSLVSGTEDAANNYARGYYTVGKDKLDVLMDAIRKVVNNCESVSAFQIMHSYAGGCGSGLTSLLLLKLSEEFGKKFRVSVGIFPSSTMSQSTVDPYNSLLHTHSAIELIDCGILFDNESLYRKALSQLKCDKPTYILMNRLISQMVTCVFLSHRYRYEGTHHIDVDELLTNLVPFPRIHFPVLSYAPIVSQSQVKHEKMDVGELTRFVFQGDAHFLDCGFENNKYTSCCLLYRGYISPKSVYDAVAKVKCDRRISFVDWCPTGFKLGLNTIPPVGVPNLPLATPTNCLCMVSGNVGICEAWQRDRNKFDLIFNKRAFVHWFVGEGLEEGEFLEARDDIITLERDYEEIARDFDDMDKTGTQDSAIRKSTTPSVEPKRPSKKPSVVKTRTSVSEKKEVSRHSITVQKQVDGRNSRKSITNEYEVRNQEVSSMSKNNLGETSFRSERYPSVVSEQNNISNNALIPKTNNSNSKKQYSYKYHNDVDYGLEIEEPSWIEGPPTINPVDLHFVDKPQKNLTSNRYGYKGNNENVNASSIDKVRLRRILVEDARNESPSKIARIHDSKQSCDLYKTDESIRFNNFNFNPKVATRSFKRRWWRRTTGSQSINNSSVDSVAGNNESNLQICDLLSKMDCEPCTKNLLFDYKVPIINTNLLTRSYNWDQRKPLKFSPNTQDNPFHVPKIQQQNEIYSSSVSSFIGNSLSPNPFQKAFQCSPFLTATKSFFDSSQTNYTLLPNEAPVLAENEPDEDETSEFSMILPPPPAFDIFKSPDSDKERITSSQKILHSMTNFHNETPTENNSLKPSCCEFIPFTGPTFSDFTPSMPTMKSSDDSKIPRNSFPTPIVRNRTNVFASVDHQLPKKRNLIISPIESLDCDASSSKHPRMSFINFIYKKFHHSKHENNSSKEKSNGKNCR